MDHAPVLLPADPFLRNIHHGQIQHFQQAVVRWEDRFCLGRFPQLPIKALDRIGRIDQAAHLLRALEIGAQVGPVVPPGLGDLRVFLVPAFGKGVQSIRCSSLIDCGVDCLSSRSALRCGHGQELLLDVLTDAGLVFSQHLRLKFALTIPGHGYPHIAEAGAQRFAAVPVPAVVRVLSLRTFSSGVRFFLAIVKPPVWCFYYTPHRRF